MVLAFQTVSLSEGYQILGPESELTNTPGIELDLHFDPISLKWIEDERDPYYEK
ncbi:MAG: hypothetical protein JNN25_04160 [Candidatus Kapabacteria bacterium]|nr:hypothetical protein [Candidatus Kapabacteria bacterium]